MTALHAVHPGTGSTTATIGRVARGIAFIGTILIIIELALLPLLVPPVLHPMLELAGSAERLGLAAEQAQGLSDRSVSELVLGPGSFAFAAPDGTPFYDASERSHLRDARLVLWLFLAAGVLSAILVTSVLLRGGPAARRAMWRTVGRASAFTAVGVLLLGALSLVAFDTLFTLFHQVAFPGGNWAFDAATQRLVQLYPFAFWQMAASVLGGLILALATLAWLLARAMSRPAQPGALAEAAGR